MKTACCKKYFNDEEMKKFYKFNHVEKYFEEKLDIESYIKQFIKIDYFLKIFVTKEEHQLYN